MRPVESLRRVNSRKVDAALHIARHKSPARLEAAKANSGRNERFIFTVATGRCGELSLVRLISNHIPGCYAAHEEPNIHPILPPPFDAYEKRFRRRYIETDELLGRGKVLRAFESGDHSYIDAVSKKRLRTIKKEMKSRQAHIYFDVSKFFGRGLHVGFSENIQEYALVHLVRDPLMNMRSYLNREKRFALDNSFPHARSNILQLPSDGMSKGELYLWSWCEMYLRYESMRRSNRVTHCMEIRTEDLSNGERMDAALDALGLEHSPVVGLPPSNTNVEQGLPETRVEEADLRIFERFCKRIPTELRSQITYLKDYDPYASITGLNGRLAS